MDLFAEDTIKYFGSQKAIEIRINEILDEILKIDKTIRDCAINKLPTKVH